MTPFIQIDTPQRLTQRPCPEVKQRGFTIMEMIVVTVIIGIIFATGAMLVGRSFEHFSTTRDVSDIEGQARVALERASRELRAIRGKSSNADLDIGTANEISFRNTSGTLIRFYRDAGSNRFMRQENTGTAQPLADYISALTVTYHDQGGASTGTRALVYYITVGITVTRGNFSNNFSTAVKVRNFE